MNKSRFSIVVLCYSVLLSILSNVAFGLTIKENSNHIIDISNELSVAEDVNSSWKISNIESQSIEWEKLEGNIIFFGISKSSIWAKIQLNNLSNDSYIRFDDPIIDHIEVFFSQNGKFINSKVAGANYNFTQREVNVTNYLFKIPEGQSTCYIKLKSKLNIQVPVAIGKLQSFMEEQHVRDLTLALYFGLMIIMVFYNLFIYISVKDKTYLYYILYIIFVTVLYSSFKGVSFEYLWPDTPYINYLIPSFASLSSIFSVLFAVSLLQSKTFLPKLSKWSSFFVWTFVACVALNLFGKYDLSAKISQLLTLICSIYLFVLGIYSHKKGVKAAKFFLLAWTLFIISVIIFILKMNNLIDYNAFTNNSVLFGSAIEAVLLSFALADRINTLRRDKDISHAESLRLAKENERIVKEQNIILEQKVEERTSELKAAQSQLVSSEKMASLGQLTAGIAHEINNPINYVLNSVKPLKRDVEDLILLSNKLDELKDDRSNVKAEELLKLKKDLDIEFSIEEINQLLDGIEDGAVRTQDIVKNLKSFSHLDEAHLNLFDLNEGIRSTLTLLKHKIKKQVSIKFNPGELNKVECNGGKMNQVFMNIISNAIDAVEENHEDNNGEIIIESRQEGENAVFTVKDNGTGISEENKSKIFDPFFTTKDVGVGTGLGMSIVFGIIQNHNGSITVDSEIDKGTTFTISIPMKFQVKPTINQED